MRTKARVRLQDLAPCAGLLLVAALAGCAAPDPQTQAPGLRVADVLGDTPHSFPGESSGAVFARADGPREFAFPEDHGAHPEFRSEWWYLTLALKDANDREFGVQFTIFRQALFPGGAVDDPWRSGQAYLGHFAVTDVEAGVHREAERLARGHPALAGARVCGPKGTPTVLPIGTPTLASEGTPTLGSKGTPTFGLEGTPTSRKGTPTSLTEGTPTLRPEGTPTLTGEGTPTLAGPKGTPTLATDCGEPGFAVWLEGWRLASDGDAWMLEAAADDFAVSMRLDATKPVILQGDRGLSPKGPLQASYYYSLPRLQASGRLQIGSHSHAVAGIGWLDREWSTSVLGDKQVGWDWFALMLDNGEDIMAFRLRRSDGSRDPYDHGVRVDASGEAHHLGSRDFFLEPLGYWRDERGTHWPIRWSLQVGERRWLIVAPVADQRMDTLLTYWEGLVHVLDPQGASVGRGYMELTGYR